jgi:hypothetical protein
MRNTILIVGVAAGLLAIGLLAIGLLAVGPFAADGLRWPRDLPAPAPPEAAVRLIPLAGALAERKAEISGLAWHGDQMILLPQFPRRTRTDAQKDGFLYAIPKAEILAVLDGRAPGPLTPRPIPFNAPDLHDDIKGFEGFEAIAVDGDRVYLTVESEQKHHMAGHLVAGDMAPDLSAITIDVTRQAEIPIQAPLNNIAYESLVLVGDTLLALYEANGAQTNPVGIAQRFDRSLAPLAPLAMPPLEYRLTDATATDAEGRFWVMNTFDPEGDALLLPAPDPLAAAYGQGPTHAQGASVERLVELAWGDRGLAITDRPPIQLELLGSDVTRNWEGLVRLDDRGFLMATDKSPETVLGFVEGPQLR